MKKLVEINLELDAILSAAIEMLDASMGNIQMLNPETQTLVVAAHRGFDDSMLEHFHGITEFDGSACGRALKHRQRVIVPDILQDESYMQFRDAAIAAGYRGVQATPLINRNGKLVGILSTHFRSPHRPDQIQLRMLDLYAQQAVHTIEASRIASSALRSEQQLRTLYEFSEATRNQDDPDVVMATATKYLGESLDGDHCFYAELYPAPQSIGIKQEWFKYPAQNLPPRDLKHINESQIEILRNGMTLAINTPKPITPEKKTPDYFEWSSEPESADEIKSSTTKMTGPFPCLVCPLRKGDETIGLLGVQQQKPRNWTLDEIRLMTQIADKASIHIEKARALQELKENESRYRTVLTTIPIAIWRTDSKGEMVPDNQSWSNYTGQPWEEFRGLGWLQAIHPDDREGVFETWKTSIDQSLSYSAKYRLRNRFGEYRHVCSRSTPVIDAQGVITEWVGFCDDIHQQSISEARNRFLVQLDDAVQGEVSPQEITQTAARLLAQYLEVNRCAYAEFERDENTFNLTGDYNEGVSSIVGRYRLTDISEDLADSVMAGKTFVCNDVESGNRSAKELAQYRSLKIASLICVPLHKSGRLIASLGVNQMRPRVWQPEEIELVQHVALRCWESIERARISRELRQNEYRLRLAQQAGRIGSFEWRITEGQLIWTEELCLLYGISLEEFSGTLEDWINRSPPESANRLRQQIEQCLAEGDSELNIEYECTHSDGQTRWLKCQAMILYDSVSCPRKMIGVVIDIDQQKRAVAALQDADRRKDEFLATLAHELRNPLAPIHNAIEVLQLGKNSPETCTELQNVIQRQVQQLVRLVDDLLDVSRITRGKIELRRDQIELTTVLKSALETSEFVIAANKHRVNYTPPETPIWLDADQTRLSQVFSNLLNNAAKYSDPHREISLHILLEENHVTVEVTDSGIGIPESMRKLIFEPFTQVDRSINRSQGGLGIGLTLVKRLVELHQGEVAVRPAASGTGSTFSVLLPRIQPQTIRQAAPQRLEPEALPARRVLVVDDTSAARYMVSKLLEKLGQTVYTADNAMTGLELAQKFRPDIIISDIGMPHIDGYQFAEMVRSNPDLDHIQLVALTGYGQESDRSLSAKAGFNCHLIKPVSTNMLYQLIMQESTGARNDIAQSAQSSS